MRPSRPARVATLTGLGLIAALAGGPTEPTALRGMPGSPAQAAAAERPPLNRLVNPDFELPLPGHPWMPAGWDTSVAGLPSVFFGRDTFLVHGGRYAISVANLSTLVPMAHNWSQSFVIDRSWWGKDAVLSIWTRSNGLLGRAFVREAVYRDTLSKMAKLWGVSRERAGDSLNIKALDDPWLELGWKSDYFVEPETDWVRRELRLHITPATNFLRVSCGINGTGQVVFDDASLVLERAQPPPPLPPHVNLIQDPGFEGDGSAWEYSLPPYEGIRVERDTTLAHSGKACMRYEDTGMGVNPAATGVCQPILNRNLGGKHFRLTAWLKTDSLQGTANVAMFFKSPQGSKNIVPKLYSGTMDWTQISLEGDSPPDTYEAWVWCMYESPARGHIYFDDSSFEVMGPAKKPATPRPSSRPSAAKKRSTAP